MVNDILVKDKNSNYVSVIAKVKVMVSDEFIEEDENGRKIVRAGTIVGGVDGSFIKGEVDEVEEKDINLLRKGLRGAALDAEGVLLQDVDVTDGPEEGIMLFKGNVSLRALPKEPCINARNVLRDINFI